MVLIRWTIRIFPVCPSWRPTPNRCHQSTSTRSRRGRSREFSTSRPRIVDRAINAQCSVQLLEDSIGVVIFERSSGGVRATPAGRHFLWMPCSILEQIEALIASTRPNGSGEAGRHVIGFCTSLTAGNLRATLLDFKELFPQVELVTVERSRTRLATVFRNGVIDVSIITGYPQPQ